jgi:hypothetical protein
MAEMRNADNILVGKPERKRPFGRPKRRWKDNIKIYLRDTRWEGVEWMHLAHNKNQWRAHANRVLNL